MHLLVFDGQVQCWMTLHCVAAKVRPDATFLPDDPCCLLEPRELATPGTPMNWLHSNEWEVCIFSSRATVGLNEYARDKRGEKKNSPQKNPIIPPTEQTNKLIVVCFTVPGWRSYTLLFTRLFAFCFLKPVFVMSLWRVSTDTTFLWFY